MFLGTAPSSTSVQFEFVASATTQALGLSHSLLRYYADYPQEIGVALEKHLASEVCVSALDDLSMRTRKVLQRHDINSLAKFRHCTKERLKGTKGCGATTLKEIEELFKKYFNKEMKKK